MFPPGLSGFVDFDPDKDISSLHGKVIFITGGTAGLGRASVLALAKHKPDHIYFTGRNVQAADNVVAEVQRTDPTVGVTFLEVDMNSLAAVKTACAKFTHVRLDILMCCAGIMNLPAALSVDGFERHFAVNHLAHAMIIQQLLPALLSTADIPGSDVRVISITSLGFRIYRKDGIDFDSLGIAKEGFVESYYQYGHSKLANIVYARELARRHPSLTAVSVHPGVVKTDLVNNVSAARKAIIYFSQYVQGVGLLDESQGRLSQLWAAAGAKKEDLVNGAFYQPVGVLSNSMVDKTVATDQDLADKLWDWTEEVLQRF